MKIHNETTTVKPNGINGYNYPLYYDVFDVNTGEVTKQITVQPGEKIPVETNEIEYIHVWKKSEQNE